jgi:sigma-B regulation protein RsbU (phosphoserine phosphatase)
MKVIIVEDERITRDQLSILLKEWGYEVLTAADGDEAWKILEKETIRLVITDILMPGADGIELCKRIRGMKREHYTYILVITGMSDQKSLFDAMFAGADDFIVKPWHNSEIRARLRTGERIIHLEDELKDRIKKLEEANMIIKTANERMMREVAFMSRMQSAMLPPTFADFPMLKSAWKHQPHSMMAGDGMNFFRLDESNFAVVMVDVAESGDAASFILGSLARKLVPIPGQPGILKLLSRKAPGYELVAPGKVIEQINREFPLDLEGDGHFSVFYGVINIARATLTYAAAGSPTPLIVKKNGKIVKSDPANLPIGKAPQKKFDQVKISLEKNDRMVFFSNGLCDLRESSGESFGHRRLQEKIKRKFNAELEEFVETIFDAVPEWNSQIQDDISVLTVEYTGDNNDGAS